MEETFSYRHVALQTSITELRGSLEEDKIFVRMRFYKCSIWHRVRTDPIDVDYMNVVAQMDLWVTFSLFKKKPPQGKAGRKVYEKFISKCLKRMSVPEDEHPFIVQKLFDAIEAAASPVDPVVVFVWEVIHRVGDGHDEPSRLNFIPASRSSIQGLEPVTVLDADPLSCAICLDDFEQQPFTRLPCTHPFHVHCIVQCLEINHLCPICRYAMPTEEEVTKPCSTCPE
ncbi:PREDICTED: uncharacterized protein LOC101309444 [Fragaria vesca subsp. vesca]|uniref:uncharacterized protein LOC101309444 n=1 Tax=Fragaria vesca subsp. vesca TaxID=101020 RepID=UPI0002C2EFBA|nr:PREDICTED: uncharacterized protein LOC101309444 [Fragaria vesca subsp. vesca]XP_011463092.1 PREDICTED: uncharacterized protein LOC101309444 [Fragaria vesca subsp. vesca]